MVCCAPNLIDSQPSEGSSQKVKTKRMDDMAESATDDDLNLTRLAGGSIVDYPPLFSPEGDLIFVISNNKILIYSATTGTLVRSLESARDALVGLHYDLNDDKFLLGCSRTGELIKWSWETGSVDSEAKFSNLPRDISIESFHLLNASSVCALITFRSNSQELQWAIFDIPSMRRLRCPVKMNLTDEPACVAVDNKNFHYFTITQGHKIWFVHYKSWKTKWGVNAYKVPITCVQTHPKEELVATGDRDGRIFMWREFWDNRFPKTLLYHWHHTTVSSIAFTAAGTSFYSGGKEAVLVKWSLDNPDQRFYTPRMSAALSYISTSPDNAITAVCTADNGIHILGAQNKPVCVIQNFTNFNDDKTGLDKFPVGVQLDPRKNCLVLNGRVGYLQFFSTYTKSLLYNMDIVMQNRLSPETHKILYDIRVTCAAFNIDWMVTGEVWDDQEHSSEVRLKFWEYLKDKQSYSLNTNAELAHEGGFQAIEFSSQQETDNLLCATLGKDNVIKIWALEDSDNIYKKGKVWCCIGANSYKNMPIQSIKFSQDGSILAAGFGNNLCIFKPESFKLKTVLTAPSGCDGAVQKVEICLPKDSQQSKSPNKGDLNGKRKKILQLFKEMIENNDGELVHLITKAKTKINKKKLDCLPNLNVKQEEMLFRKIQSMNELNMFQKLTLYQKLEIFCSVAEESKGKMLRYINSTLNAAKYAESNMLQSVRDICCKHRFKAKFKLHKYIVRKQHYSTQINNKLVPLLDLLNLDESNNNKSRGKIQNNDSRCNGLLRSNVRKMEEEESQDEYRPINGNVLPPVQIVSTIKSVHFAAGEFAHFVVVCTEHRILIWNLLTLKLQGVLKLSVHKMVVDPLTSLFAAFTKNNELYVFLPNAPMVIYRRTKLPPIHGACWVPRRHPKSQSINIDWQSMSTLYFLTDKQELMFLAAKDDVELSISTAPSFMNDAKETTKYSTFGAFAIKQINAKTKQTSNSTTAFTIGVPGKSAAKRLTEMSTHAMAPVSLLCNNFMKSLTKVEVEEKSSNSVQRQSVTNYEDKESDDELLETGRRRRANMLSETAKMQTSTDISGYIRQEHKLRRILKEKVYISF